MQDAYTDIVTAFAKIERRYMIAIWVLTAIAAGLMIAATLLEMGV